MGRGQRRCPVKRFFKRTSRLPSIALDLFALCVIDSALTTTGLSAWVRVPLILWVSYAMGARSVSRSNTS